MRIARLIYNPVAGKKAFAAKLDNIIHCLQEYDWQVIPYRTTGPEDDFLPLLEGTDAIFAAGGDGTVHQVINALMLSGLDLPLGIFPVGTANDFAAHLGLPLDIAECCDVIGKGKITKVDVGQANERYFINVASAGLLTEIPHKTDTGMKNVLGKLAYYLKGIEEIPNFRPIEIELVNHGMFYRQEVLLFLIVNGCTAGGFNLVSQASINDGVFDVILVKPCNLGQLLALFLKLFRGEHLNDTNIEYFQASKLSIDCNQLVNTDLDGENGPQFPLYISVLPRALRVFAPRKRM